MQCKKGTLKCLMKNVFLYFNQRFHFNTLFGLFPIQLNEKTKYNFKRVSYLKEEYTINK